jgi:hypothetical protein
MPSMKERQDSIPSSLRSISLYAVAIVLGLMPIAYYGLKLFFGTPSDDTDWLKWLSIGANIPLVVLYFFITISKLRNK